MTYSPADDGVNHINTYSRGQTGLGRALSNFHHAPFELSVHGGFESVEGYCYWLETGRTDEQLRHLYGNAAKQYGRTLERIETDVVEFRSNIRQAVRAKLAANPEILVSLCMCELPLTHYFWYGKIDKCKVIPIECDWWLDIYDEVREQFRPIIKEEIKKGRSPFTIADMLRH